MQSIFSVSGHLGSESWSLKGRKTIVIAETTVFDGGDSENTGASQGRVTCWSGFYGLHFPVQAFIEHLFCLRI